MGLFFRGREILDETVLKHLLGKGVEPIAKWNTTLLFQCTCCKKEFLADRDREDCPYCKGRIIVIEKLRGRVANYDTEAIEGTRIWLWKNMETGYIIATGDEGNGWCVELANGYSKDEIFQKLMKKGLIPSPAPFDKIS